MHITATREAILSATAPLMAVAQRGMKLGGTGVQLVTLRGLGYLVPVESPRNGEAA